MQGSVYTNRMTPIYSNIFSWPNFLNLFPRMHIKTIHFQFGPFLLKLYHSHHLVVIVYNVVTKRKFSFKLQLKRVGYKFFRKNFVSSYKWVPNNELSYLIPVIEKIDLSMAITNVC